MTPNNKRIIVFDTEIKNMILGRNESMLPDIRYCNGWTDFAGMGISVVCVYDMPYGDPAAGIMHTLTPEENEEHATMLQKLINRADYVVGFNNHSFDNPLLAASGFIIPPEKSYDIYAQIIDAAGLSNASFSARKGYRLDDVAKANGIPGKNIEGGGALAPVLYQTGELEKLYSYCENDVSMTVRVLTAITDMRCICPRTASILPVVTPHQKLGTVQTGLF